MLAGVDCTAVATQSTLLHSRCVSMSVLYSMLPEDFGLLLRSFRPCEGYVVVLLVLRISSSLAAFVALSSSSFRVKNAQELRRFRAVQSCGNHSTPHPWLQKCIVRFKITIAPVGSNFENRHRAKSNDHENSRVVLLACLLLVQYYLVLQQQFQHPTKQAKSTAERLEKSKGTIGYK